MEVPAGGGSPKSPKPWIFQAEVTPKSETSSGVSVRMRSVDDWPLAKILYQISGGKPRRVAVRRRRRDPPSGILLLGGACHNLVVVP
jgi:hypothetical protein